MDMNDDVVKIMQANNKELRRIADALVVLKVAVIAFTIALLAVAVKNFL